MRIVFFAIGLAGITGFDVAVSPQAHADLRTAAGFACLGAFNVIGVWWVWLAAGLAAEAVGGRDAY